MYFGILTTDTVKMLVSFLRRENLFNPASYQSFKMSAMRPEAIKNSRANRTETMSSLKEKIK